MTERSQSADPLVALEGVVKTYDGEQGVHEVNFEVYPGEIVTLLGPSGCGKTTTLRLIAGLEQPDRGRIQIGGRVVADETTFVPPEKRDVGIVFQEFALFPHLTVTENIQFGLDDLTIAERDERVETMLELVELTPHADDYPDELSGGQRQRVALARSLAPAPKILLLDEPFSNLDEAHRVRMREEVRRILDELEVTGISVTHDQEEAMSIADRMAIMTEGTLRQIGAPESVFQRPNSRFVADFLGHASFIPAVVQDDCIETPLGPIPRTQLCGHETLDGTSEIEVLVRPDDLAANPVSESGATGRITYRRYLGSTILYRVEIGENTTVECLHNHADQVELDSQVSITLTADHELTWFPRDSERAGYVQS